MNAVVLLVYFLFFVSCCTPPPSNATFKLTPRKWTKITLESRGDTTAPPLRTTGLTKSENLIFMIPLGSLLLDSPTVVILCCICNLRVNWTTKRGYDCYFCLLFFNSN